MIKVSIVGVTGYVGLELLRLLQTHPEVEIKHLLSRSQPGEKIAESVSPVCRVCSGGDKAGVL